MKIISFDVGIKNMAYCIFSLKNTETNPFEIIDWNVVSLLEKEEPKEYCNSIIKKVIKKGKKENNKTKQNITNEIIEQKICCHIGTFKKGTNIYCNKHSKTQTEWLIPESKFSQKVLKKTKIEDLIKLASELKIENIGKKRADIMKCFDDFIIKKCLEPVLSVKNKSAGDVDLVSIGKKMKEIFDNVLREHKDISHVLIENQISPLANRMKTIQGMLSQYFIMQYDKISIEFISSSNKLKIFLNTKKEKEEKEENQECQNQSQKYKSHKKDGVYYSKKVLENNEWIKWELDSKTNKKDDLADCFLQGLWYLLKMKKIEINCESYKINAGNKNIYIA